MRSIQSRLLFELKVNADQSQLDLLKRAAKSIQLFSQTRTDRKLSKTPDFSTVFLLNRAINLRSYTFFYSITAEKINWFGTVN